VRIVLRSDLEELVRASIVVALKLETVNLGDIHRREVASWDSLKHVELIFLMEDQFDIQFDEYEMTEMNSLSKIVDILESKIVA
jgi:acyl carrier protein